MFYIRYYNATAQIVLTPLIGMYPNQSVCPNLEGRNITAEFPARLAITEKGSYNEGQNLVNTLLTLWSSGYNFSSNGQVSLMQRIIQHGVSSLHRE